MIVRKRLNIFSFLLGFTISSMLFLALGMQFGNTAGDVAYEDVFRKDLDKIIALEDSLVKDMGRIKIGLVILGGSLNDIRNGVWEIRDGVECTGGYVECR